MLLTKATSFPFRRDWLKGWRMHRVQDWHQNEPLVLSGHERWPLELLSSNGHEPLPMPPPIDCVFSLLYAEWLPRLGTPDPRNDRLRDPRALAVAAWDS
jgi:hypothetical protein